ncbi:MAG TPA: aminoacyl-tRNA hydrolase [Bdellovibrionales bacterium]|nr:aminoacyl-tRNA hydrolase [Bdellovibrionales bacterium]
MANWLIVGLGNPGPKYEKTRHNAGFLCLDHLLNRVANGANFKNEHKAHVTRISIGSEQAFLAKPQTYMNLSGESVQAIMHFYKIELANLVVAHDEVDLPFNQMKVQKNRGPGGHNGLKSINQHLGTQDYYRIKLGVGRPTVPMDVADFVLQNFSKDEEKLLPEFWARGAQAIETLVLKGYNEAATLFNKKTE